ncbi:MAG: hypothetical protein ACFWTN_04665 [Clostridium sp.]|jgi:hypothetical protein
MGREKTLKILAWAFSITAIAAAIYNAVTGKGAKECTALLTFSLILQFFYAKELKQNK